ncbi:MAG: protein translocase subunit SecF [Caulobacterales bacterium]
MKWPLIRYLPKKTNFRFVKSAKFFATLSILCVLASFASFASAGFRENPIALYNAAAGGPLEKLGAVGSKAFNLGIDFQGGTLIEFTAPFAIDLSRVREYADRADVGEVQVQNFGDDTHAVVRFENQPGRDTNEAAEAVQAQIRLAVDSVSFQNVAVVGPKVSGELFMSGVIALGLAIVLMLVYIWFRFELQFGIGSVMALFHDVILTMGLLSVLRIEFSLTTIAALLTIVGYSMNDTVVVFDRLRENLRKYKRMPIAEVIDLSINETLSRTIITGLTAILALFSLLYLGGPTLFPFTFAMIFGIVIGTYSSIYVAAPSVLLLRDKRRSAGSVAPEAEAQTSG